MPLQYPDIYIKKKGFYENLLLLAGYLQFAKTDEF
jgi:hypothetical protein